MPIKEVLAQLLGAVQSAWRFRWRGVAVAWILCLAGWTWVVLQPNVYEAKASVYVDSSSVLSPILNNRIVAPDVATELGYVRQALLGREQLERVVSENDLDELLSSDSDHERLMSTLRTDIRITSRDGPNRVSNTVYNISYRHSDRHKAIGVVSTLLNSLVEATRGAGREGTDTAERFLDDRILEYENRLQQAEFARAEFKKQNADRLPGSEGGYFERMRAESTALDDSNKALRLAQARRDRLLEQLNSESPVIPAGFEIAEPPPNSLDARIRDYRAQLDTLLLEFTDKHPDVVNVREALERLERQRGEQLAALGVNDPDAEVSALDSNPIYQASRIALNQIEVEIDALSAEVREHRGKLEALQSLIDEVPQVEAELAKLNRDYDVIYENYQSLVRSRETQELSRKAAATDDVDFRVIDPPMTDFDPVAPKRLMLVALVFFSGLGAGGAVCWLFSQLKPVFSSVARLRDVVGLPVVGAVTQAWQGQRVMRRRFALLGFATSIGALGLLFAAGVAIELFGPGVHSLVGSS